MTREEYLRAWARVHRAPPPRGLVRWWLSLVHVLARPFVRAGTSPTVLTVAGLVGALACLPVAALGGRWALAVPVLVVVSGVVDNLDGAVAVQQGRVSAEGAVLDALADRLADCAYLAALWLLGAPGPVVVVAGLLALLAEYVRARAQAAGVADVGVITVGERPTRVLVAASAALAAGVHPASAGAWATGGAAAALAVGAAAMAQLLPVVRRQLRDLPGIGGPFAGGG